MPLTPEEELELLELEEAEAQGAEASPGVMSRLGEAAQAVFTGSGPAADRMRAMPPSQMTGAESLDKAVTGTPPLAMPIGAAPAVLQKLAGLFSNTARGRAAAGGVQGAVQGAMDNPQDRLAGAAKGGLIGGGVGVASEGIAKLLGKVGDVGMQAAVGRKKYTPGVGTTLADEGVVGTRGMMQGQVKNKLASRGAELEELAGQSDKAINVGPEALELGENAMRGVSVPGSGMSPQDLPKAQAINEFVDDMAMRGSESPVQALARRRAAGNRAYSGREDPLKSLIGQLSKQEQQVYSSALKEAVPEIAPVDKAYGALKRAQTGLDAEIALPRSLMGLVSTGANVLPGGSLGLSLAGQAGVRGGRVAKGFNNPALRYALLKAFNKKE